MMLDLVFVETSLELVPPEIVRHPSVKRNAKRRGKRAEETLLDRSLHHYAMGRIADAEKRGRPDILHFCMLEAMGSPLNRKGHLRLWANTLQGYNVEVTPSTRPPRDCIRFNSLMEQLFINGQVPPDSKEPLMRLTKSSLKDFVKRSSPSKVIALSSHGEESNFPDVANMLSTEEKPMVLIGAYPTGPMKGETLGLADEVFSVYPESLEAWTITSRIVYEYERAIGLI
jgi:rRNA small subunit pseudouridine methyltransferase Nep1